MYTTDSIIIYIFPTGPFDTNAYLIECCTTKKTAIIDPGVESVRKIEPVILKEKLIPEKIILTHSHWDHTADVATCAKKYSIPVYVHELDKDNVISPGSDLLPSFSHIEPYTPEHLLQDKETVTIGNTHWIVLHTPGHSPGSICLWNQNENILISGDTLFKETCGNVSFPTSDPDKMWYSLLELTKLPPGTIVFPGHGPSTSISKESSWMTKAKEMFDLG